MLTAPPPPPPPPPPPAAPVPIKIVKVIPRQFDAGKLMAPKVIPKEIATIKEEELPPLRRHGVARGSSRRCLRRRGRWSSGWRTWWHYRCGSDGGSSASAASAPSLPLRKVETPQRIVVGGNVQNCHDYQENRSELSPAGQIGPRFKSSFTWRRSSPRTERFRNGSPLGGPALLIRGSHGCREDSGSTIPTILNGVPVQVDTYHRC